MSATVFALLALLATVAASNVVTTDWQDCSKPGGFFQVKEVTLTPEPVKPGDLAKFAIDAVSSESWQRAWCGGSGMRWGKRRVTTSAWRPRPTPPLLPCASAGKDVDGGTIRMVVHYHFVPVWVQNDKLCDKVKKTQLAAPLLLTH